MASPRDVTPDERDEWLRNSTASGPRKTDKAILVQHCQRVNRRRWRRFKKDYEFFGKVLVRLEMNPEDARWLL
jgi:hypothetical protein